MIEREATLERPEATLPEEPSETPLTHNTSKQTPETIERLATALPRGPLLDAPAGSGALARKLARAGFEVTAAEIDRDGFLATEVPCVPVDLDGDLPFEDQRFSVITTMDGIEHLENPFHFVRECARVLKIGGHLIVSTPNVTSIRSRARFFFTGFHNKFKLPLDETRPDPLHHINPLTYQELRYALHVSGLELIECTTNRVKGAAWPYLLIWPLVYLATTLAFRREKIDAIRKAHPEIRRHLLSRDVFLGETLILVAKKTGEPALKVGPEPGADDRRRD
ncbi:MAG: methyltransferase domain-containing protein [Planctomycetota bacterium]